MEALRTNPVKVIRAYCLECCLNSAKEVSLCPAAGCPLHPFRMGKNPYRKKFERSEEWKVKMKAGRERSAAIIQTA